ncbi:unnamed protein product, partial [Ectocarpus fasciculatus]
AVDRDVGYRSIGWRCFVLVVKENLIRSLLPRACGVGCLCLFLLSNPFSLCHDCCCSCRRPCFGLSLIEAALVRVLLVCWAVKGERLGMEEGQTGSVDPAPIPIPQSLWSPSRRGRLLLILRVGGGVFCCSRGTLLSSLCVSECFASTALTDLAMDVRQSQCG